jgi:L-asparaginase II
LRVTDASEAESELTEAEMALTLTERRGEDAEAAKARVEAARAAVDECYEVLTVTALPPADLEALIAAHPPTGEQKDAVYNQDTFRPALFAACVEGDMTEQDWAQWCTKGPVSLGERNELFWVAWGVNGRAADLRSLPKG